MKLISIAPKHKVASFDVDCQKTFTPKCPDELPVPEGDDIAPALNQQAEKAGFRIGSKDAHSPHAVWVANEKQAAFQALDFPQADTVWPLHAVPGTQGFELIDGLPPVTAYDFFIWKGVELDIHPYGACYHDLDETMSTGVIEFLSYNNVNTVIVGGLATDFCVKATCLQLLQAGFQLYLNQAGTRGLGDESTQRTYQAIKDLGGQVISSSEQLINSETHDH